MSRFAKIYLVPYKGALAEIARRIRFCNDLLRDYGISIHLVYDRLRKTQVDVSAFARKLDKGDLVNITFLELYMFEFVVTSEVEFMDNRLDSLLDEAQINGRLFELGKELDRR